MLLGEQVTIHLRAGRRPEASEAVRRLAKLDGRRTEGAGARSWPAGSEPEFKLTAALSKARLLEFDREYDAALETLASVRPLAAQTGRSPILTTHDLVTARILESAGRSDEATSCLVAAVERAAPLGLFRTFLSEGAPIRTMLARLRTEAWLSNGAASYLDRLLGGGPKAPTAATLTRRQAETLSLAATGMSYKQIALTLEITYETVKWNLKKVYAKLEVSNRYDAAIRARRLGLID
jgi:LuxR family maltose regulon positive regulatory protein